MRLAYMVGLWSQLYQTVCMSMWWYLLDEIFATAKDSEIVYFDDLEYTENMENETRFF